MNLSIQLLGGFGLRADEREIAPRRWRLNKGAALLKVLALAHGHRMHREELYELLWPSLPDTARQNLNQTVHVTCKLLGCDIIRREGEMLVLGTPTGSVSVDVEVFRRAAAEAARDRDEASFRRAVALYTGDLLPEDRNQEWVVAEREALRSEQIELLMGLARVEEQRGDLEGAAATLRRVVAMEPAHEEAHKGLVRVLAALGDTRAALAQYRLLEEALEEHLGVEPDSEAQQLKAALDHRAVAARPRAAPSESPRPAVVSSVPAPSTSFVGRASELRVITSLLASSARLITLAGPGGVGKTRLAIHVAQREVAHGRTAWFVDLSSVADPSLVLDAVGGALGFLSPQPPTLDAIRAHIGDGAAVLVMDNAEHLLPRARDVADALLAGCGRLRILATSRQPLGAAGEHVRPIAPLDVPDERALPDLERLGQADAVRLFVERARSADPGFALTQENAPAVLRVCRQVDGIPLAIELAASQANVLSPEQIAERLSDPVRALMGRDPTVPTRHRTLASTVAWSFDLLSEEQRALLRRLSVFVGGCDLEAAEAVCTGGVVCRDRVLDLVRDLIDRSLLATDAAARGVTKRYRLLEAVRQFGLQRLEAAGELRPTQARHAAYYRDMAEQAHEVLGFTETTAKRRGSADQAAWIARLEHEHANFLAALGWATEHDAELALRLAAGLHRFWWMKGYLEQGIEKLSGALAAPGAGDAAGRAAALYGAGHLALARADFAAVRRFMEEALRICEASGDLPGAARAHHVLGTVANWHQQPELATQHLRRALSIRESIGEQLGVAETLYETAILAIFGQEYDRAAEILTKIAPIAEEAGDARSSSYVALMAGRAALGQGKVAEARAAFRRSLDVLRELDDAWGLWICLDGVSHLAAAQGDAARAIALAASAERVRNTIDAHLPPAFRHENEQRLASSRLTLPDRDAASAWAEGYSRDVNAVVVEAAAYLEVEDT